MSLDTSDPVAALIAERGAATAPAVERRSPFGTRLDSEIPRVRGKTGAEDEKIGRLLTVDEVAALLNVPRRWVYRRVALKPPDGIPHVKVGKYVRFLESDLRDYLERLRRN